MKPKTGYVRTEGDIQDNSLPLLYIHKLPKDEVKEKLEALIRTLDEDCRDLCRARLTNEFFHRPASLSKHHVWEGGLAQHTLEVMTIAKNNVDMSFRLCRDTVLTACFYHDIGKIYDLAGSEECFSRTKHYDMIYHICRSYHEWMKDSEGKVDEGTRMGIAHCILAHHGQLQYKSPVEPQTPEAWAVHLADMTSVFVFHDKKIKKNN